MPYRALRVMLLQARDANDPCIDHEVQCFAERAGVAPAQIVRHDLLGGPPTMREVRSVDAVMVGGSGDYYVSKRDLPNFAALMDFLGELVDVAPPVFASCFGYQCLVQALGGEIIHDPDNTEVGTFELTLSDAGRADPLFGRLPDRFNAQMGHKDRAARHPEGIPNLAGSERSPFQALRIPGKPIWASQFHPELTHDDNLYRYKSYLQGYAADLSPEEVEKSFENYHPSPHSAELIRGFLEVVFG